MFFELPWVGGAQEDAMVVAIHIKYSVCQNCHITFYLCVCVCVWICYRDNSKLRASIFTKLGLYSVGEGSDRLQLIKFWSSCAPGKGVCDGANFFWLRLTTASAQ